MLLFIVAGVFFATYFVELGKPINEAPVYPRSPDSTPPEIRFIPNTPLVRTVRGSMVTINIFVVDWQNEIESCDLTKYDVALDGSLENYTILEEGGDYIVYKPGSTEYKRKLYPGSRDELRIIWRRPVMDTSHHQIHIIAFDSAKNRGDMYYNFKIEVVQNTPSYYFVEPEEFELDRAVLPIDMRVTSNGSMISFVRILMDGIDIGGMAKTTPGSYYFEIHSINVPTGLHTCTICVVLRSSITLTYTFCTLWT